MMSSDIRNLQAVVMVGNAHPTAQNSVMCFLIGRMKIEQENGFPARPPIPSLRKEAMGAGGLAVKSRFAGESEVSLSFLSGRSCLRCDLNRNIWEHIVK